MTTPQTGGNTGGRPPLGSIRVIDLATHRAEMAGRVLADLGAEVIKVEPPGGAEARRLPPFREGHLHEEDASLYWAAVGLGKRSVVLDIHTPEGVEDLKQLAATADVLVESFDPGTMDLLGLGYEALAEINPALVYVSVTPYGQRGPDSQSPATDLTLEAAGGLLSLQGDGDRPPVPVGYPQASFHAGAQAAADAVLALYERRASGRGQHLDVSTQAAMVWTLMNATGYPPNHGGNPPTTCETRHLPPPQLFPGVRFPRLIPCADGYVSCTVTLAGTGPRTMHAVLGWAESEGALPAELKGRDWNNWMVDARAGELAPELIALAIETITAFLGTKTKIECQTFAVKHRVLMAPIYTVEDLLRDPHLQDRGYWTQVDGLTHPGPFAKLSGTPIALDRAAPALGADQALVAEASARPHTALHGSGERRPVFEGLKVADFAWVGVGPIISRALADHGATVIHVESSTRPDVLRTLPAFKDGVPGLDRSQFMANFNSSKLGLALDLARPEGQAMGRRLADWADVVVESFTPGNMAKFGLDYATLCQDRGDLVMLSTCLRGQTGPDRTYTGFGGQGAALAGIHAVTGWPDRPPSGPWGAYTDFINPRFGVAALASALLHRAETGEGQYIDLSQSEAGIRFIEPLVLDYVANGRVATPAGHDSLYACPHGVFATRGTERYVAIAVETVDQWKALRTLAPLADFAERRYDDLAERQAAKHAIEDRLRAWCADQEPGDIVAALKRAGVPAALVEYPSDLYEDAQLAYREFFVTLDHSAMGPTPYDGLATTFSETPGRLRKAAPTIGEDTDHVLREVLGLSDDEIVELAVAGVLT